MPPPDDKGTDFASSPRQEIVEVRPKILDPRSVLPFCNGVRRQPSLPDRQYGQLCSVRRNWGHCCWAIFPHRGLRCGRLIVKRPDRSGESWRAMPCWRIRQDDETSGKVSTRSLKH